MSTDSLVGSWNLEPDLEDCDSILHLEEGGKVRFVEASYEGVEGEMIKTGTWEKVDDLKVKCKFTHQKSDYRVWSDNGEITEDPSNGESDIKEEVEYDLKNAQKE